MTMVNLIPRKSGIPEKIWMRKATRDVFLRGDQLLLVIFEKEKLILCVHTKIFYLALLAFLGILKQYHVIYPDLIPNFLPANMNCLPEPAR